MVITILSVAGLPLFRSLLLPFFPPFFFFVLLLSRPRRKSAVTAINLWSCERPTFVIALACEVWVSSCAHAHINPSPCKHMYARRTQRTMLQARGCSGQRNGQSRFEREREREIGWWRERVGGGGERWNGGGGGRACAPAPHKLKP